MKKMIVGGLAAAAVVGGLALAAPAPAHASFAGFIMCPSGRDGVASEVTTCAFADNVRRGFYAQGMPRTVIAYSPVTNLTYAMGCYGPIPAHFLDGETLMAVHCVGGNDAEVVIW